MTDIDEIISIVLIAVALLTPVAVVLRDMARDRKGNAPS